MQTILPALQNALAARQNLLDEKHQSALRLFNGFYEGDPHLVIDLYADTALLYNYANPPLQGSASIRTATDYLRTALPWLNAILVKTRHGNPEEKRGILIYGGKHATRIIENGVRYALDLTMNQDASFYLDTRNLRQWASQTLGGKTVLNTFAYTGSLGVAAKAGGAQVTHLDLNRDFLNLAKTSYTLNGFPIQKADFLAQDFFPAIQRLKREERGFDCIFLDPPFFSLTQKGRVDLQTDNARLINKLRPLVNDGGYLVVINNALFLSGEDYLATLQELCTNEHLQLESLLPVPPDITGYPQTIVRTAPVNPAPFNHPTKIALLRIRK